MKAAGAWAGFWQGEASAAGGATLANLPPPLQSRLDAPWHDLARALPPKTRVLDLATGGGIVLDLLQQGQSGLDLVGIDTAPQLPRRRGMTLKGGISTDRLPFPDGSFGLVTSRFGIEYGSLEEGASEAGRVLRSGGHLCLLVHHSGSEVVRHNRARREALHWAARESGWLDKARSVVRARQTFAMPTPPAFRAAPNEGRTRYPAQSVAWELLTGLSQLLDSGVSEAGLTEFSARADGELQRLSALLAAACDVERLALLTGALKKAGVALEAVRTVDEPGGAPLAWHVAGRKA